LGPRIGGYAIKVFALLFVLVMMLLTVGSAELVRSSCRRLLRNPVPRGAASQLPGLD
jgi:hypothetical protein